MNCEKSDEDHVMFHQLGPLKKKTKAEDVDQRRNCSCQAPNLAKLQLIDTIETPTLHEVLAKAIYPMNLWIHRNNSLKDDR